jgi:hypothetical protein
MTGRPGAGAHSGGFMRGLAAAHEAGLPMRINIVVSNRNAHEIPQMKAIADRYGIPSVQGNAAQAQAPHRLQRRDHPLPRRPARQGIHLQGRPRPPGRPDRRGSARPAQARGCCRHAPHPARRVLRLHHSEDVRDLHAAGQPLPAGARTARSFLPARKEVTHECPASTGGGDWRRPASTHER